MSVFVDGFEDGDAAEWSGNMTAQTGTVISGSYSGELSSSTAYESSSRSYPETTGRVTAKVRIGTQSGNQYDSVRLSFNNGGNAWGRVYFSDDGHVEVNDGLSVVDTGATWSADTTYTVEMDPDFGNDQYTVYLDGTDLGTYQLYDTEVTATSAVQVANDTDDAGITRSAFYDDFQYTINVPTLAIDNTAETQVDLSWTDESVDGYNIYRAEASGSATSDYTQIDSVSGSATSYSDTGVVGGEQYYYRVTATENNNESDLSNEESTTTPLPAPSDLAVDAVSGDQFDLSWTDNSTGEDGFRVYRRHDGGAWTQDGSVSANTTTYTTTSLLDGEQYDVEVRAYTEHTESASGVVTATTELSDATIDSLDNGIEDEITVNWTDVIDNGSYRVHYKESSATSWTDWGTVSETATSATITGLEDGEEYDVRLRSETEHVTGDWSPTASIVTAFPTPANPSVSNVTKTSADVSWDDQADNEDGFRVYHAREYDYGWGPWQQVADIDANTGTGTVTYTDTELSPGNTYKWQVEAYTEDATATAETVSATTTTSGRPRTKTSASGWYVEVEHPSGQTLRPQLLDDPEFTPALNDYPTVEIPVPRDERWQANAFEEAPLSVWQDGCILPIDELVNVRMEPGRTVLEGRGGSALEDRVQAEYDNTEAHVAAKELGQNNTTYTMNVDDPASSTQSNTEMQSADTSSELQGELNSPFDATDPLYIQNGVVKTYQTCWTREAEQPDSTGGSIGTTIDDTDSSDSAALFFNESGLWAEYQVTPEYDIPAGEFVVAHRGRTSEYGTNTFDITAYVEGEDLGQVTLAPGPAWTTSYAYSNPISAGETVTVRLESSGSGDEAWLGDVIAPRDQRYSYNDSNNLDSNNYLPGPEYHPDAVDVIFEDEDSAFNVAGGRLEVSMNDVSNGQAIAISNDDGSSYITASNTSTLEQDFSSAGTSIRARVTLSRYGSQSKTPTTGVQSQALDAYTLYADLEDTPVLDAQKYDGQLKDVFNQIANYGNFIWELRRRDASSWSVEWTQPGQRTADSDASIVEYSVGKNVEASYEKAVIKGAAQPVRGEQFTSNHDSWVDLNQANLVPATNIVRDPSTGTVYSLGSDYELDRSQGRIKVLSSGSMSDATTYEVDYEYKTQGSYTASGAGSDPDTIVRTISSLASNRACEQAALYLIQRVQEPLWEATVTLPKNDAGRSLVDDLALEDLPTQGERMEVQQIEQTPERVVLQLGSRQSVGEVINDIQSRISSVSDRV